MSYETAIEPKNKQAFFALAGKMHLDQCPDKR